MMISCKEASRLASQSLEKPLSWWQRVKLHFHARVCHWCGGHGRDLQAIRHACKCTNPDESPTEELSPEARQRIMKAIREQLEKDGDP